MAGLVSDTLLNNLRSVAYRQLITPVTVRRRTKSEGPNGTVVTESDVFSTTCWVVVKARHGMTVEPGGMLAAVTGAEIRFRFGTDVRIADILVIGDQRWTIQDTNEESTITLLLKAWCERVD